MSKRTAAKTEDEAVAQYAQSLAPDSSFSTDDEILQRAQDYHRLMKNYAQELSTLKPSPQLKFVTACVLAYEYFKKHVSKSTAAAKAGVSAKTFESFRAYAGKLLKVGSNVSIKDVAILLGLEECIPSATTLFSEFKAAYGDMYEGVPDDQAIAVAVFVCADRMGLASRKKDLIALSKLKPAGFALLIDQMIPLYRQVSGDSLSDSKQPSSGTKSRKRKRKAATPLEEDEREASTSTETENKNAADLPHEHVNLTKEGILKNAFDNLRKSDSAKFKALLSKYRSQLPKDFSV